jgi:hypothetical protein
VEGSTRGRLSRAVIAAALAATCATPLRASVGSAHQTGVFALLGGTPKIVSTFWADHAAGLTATINIRQFQLDGKTPILDYDVEMEKLIHLVVVRDDFATFSHLHPAFDTTTGTFLQPFTKSPNHRYYVYADTTPHGIGQQVFRFTIESDGPIANSSPSASASPPSVLAGPYRVTLSATTFPANQPQNLNLTVMKGARPADDLGTYLGAAAHAVFINTLTLAYVHVHPMARKSQDAPSGRMDMGASAQAGPFMRMMLPALPPGTYKLWVQFRGANDKVYTAAFTTLAR